MSKIALAMIVKGTDQEAELLDRCLQYASNSVDDIFITITHKPGEEVNKEVMRVAKSWQANISTFMWVNDFSAARNFNFSQVPKEFDYIFWLDADDVLRGTASLKETVKANQDVDAFSLFYLYAFDEWKNPIVVHTKTRIVRNDGCVEWAGKLHEDFKENRAVSRKLIEDIEVLHLTDTVRIDEAKERNLEVAEGQLKTEPGDPRSYWNVGNSLKALGRDTEALEIFEEFLRLSRSDDEKYIVRLRMAESCWSLGQLDRAIDHARYAIGMRPHFPDAYHLLGSIYLESRRFEDARDMYMLGLERKPPYYSIVVYNPRDYDYVPLMNLAKAYFNLSMPTLAMVCLKACQKIYPKDENIKGLIEKMGVEVDKFDKVTRVVKRAQKLKKKSAIKKLLDSVPPELQDHPGICNLRNTHFIKEETSGKDLVIFCGFTEKEWTPEIVGEGIGGSEEAVINLSSRLAKRGWNVTVYNNCGHKERVFDGVTYKPFWSWNYRDKQDVVIVWRTPRTLDYKINAKLVCLDMHDVMPPGELNAARLARVDKIFVKSKFHRSLFPNVPDDKFVVIPNGINADQFSETIERDQYLMINTSSPDRSLNILLDLFARIKERVPEAKLHWAYGWEVFDAVHGSDSAIMDWKKKVLEKMESVPGVTNLGKIGHAEVAKLYLKAGVFAYPTEFAEIHCISALKAQAAGCIPVTTDFAALKETVQYGVTVHSEKTKDTWSRPYQFDFGLEDKSAQDLWVESCIEMMRNPIDRKEMREWAKQYDWEKITDEWESQIAG